MEEEFKAWSTADLQTFLGSPPPLHRCEETMATSDRAQFEHAAPIGETDL
jgi:hypothetical protein